MENINNRKHRKKGKRRHKGLPIYRKVGYSFVSVYAVAAIVLLSVLVGTDMLPGLYLGALGIVLLVLGVLTGVMQKWKISSVIADVICTVLTVVCVAGCVYADKMDSTIRDVATVSASTDVIGVYVMDADPAQELADVVDYQFGIATAIDRTNTDKAMDEITFTIGKDPAVTEYGDVFALLDALNNGEAGVIVVNSAYISTASEAENYAWAEEGLREIASFTYESADGGSETVTSQPDADSNSFIMYLSGIDTYGGISTRSRSDVNILAVVNTETKDILLLSTPRDYYISYSETGGAKDKLTHAGIYGINASIDALEQLYDVDVNYYLRVNFSGFIDIINALGGVDVNSDYDFIARGTEIHKGVNHLTGEEALSFARERYSFKDGDFQRGRNQMEVIRAVIQKTASSSLLTNYMSVMNAVAGSFETNMSQEEIPDLVKMQLSDMASWNITSYTSEGQVSSAETYSMPGQMLSVVIPDESSVEEAKNMITDVIEGTAQ